MKDISNIAAFVKYHREKLALTQAQLADMSGVGIHFIRNLEQGISALKLDKVNQVLKVFGHRLSTTPNSIDPYQVWFNFLNKAVKITKKDKKEVYGFLVQEIRNESSEIIAWKLVPNPKALEWHKKRDDSLTQIINQSEITEITLQK